MKIPPPGTEVYVKCLKANRTDKFTEGKIYQGKRRKSISGVNVKDDTGYNNVIILFECAFGVWELVENKSKNKNDIWDALVASCKR